MCDLNKYTFLDVEYQRNTKGKCCDLQAMFTEEFMVLKISTGESFTHFWTNIHPWKDGVLRWLIY